MGWQTSPLKRAPEQPVCKEIPAKIPKCRKAVIDDAQCGTGAKTRKARIRRLTLGIRSDLDKKLTDNGQPHRRQTIAMGGSGPAAYRVSPLQPVGKTIGDAEAHADQPKELKPPSQLLCSSGQGCLSRGRSGPWPHCRRAIDQGAKRTAEPFDSLAAALSSG